jgi:hypothetical protein
MTVVVECSYVYDNLDWAAINEYSDSLKRECLMDPDHVNVTVEERDDGDTAYTYTGKVRIPRACAVECVWCLHCLLFVMQSFGLASTWLLF